MKKLLFSPLIAVAMLMVAIVTTVPQLAEAGECIACHAAASTATDLAGSVLRSSALSDEVAGIGVMTLPANDGLVPLPAITPTSLALMTSEDHSTRTTIGAGSNELASNRTMASAVAFAPLPDH